MAGGPKHRMLVVGLDAADREVIEHWADRGFLPNIAAMRSKGLWRALSTTAETLHVSAWPSIFSGTEPDKHGLYHAYVMRAGEQAPVRPRPQDCPVPFLWRLLDEHGKRCVVMDAFMTCPLPDFRGVQITDWGSWTWFAGQDIRPASVKKAIRRRFGAYPAENHSKVGMTPPADPMGFRERLLKGVRKKTDVVRWLMASQAWDFFLVVFGECHAAGHYFWHYQDPSYFAYPNACDSRLRTALRDVYVALDRALGELIHDAGPATNVLVLSGDGMGPNFSGSHILGALLDRMELGALGTPAGLGSAGAMGPPVGEADGEAPAAKRQAPAAKHRSVTSTLRGLVPKSARAAVSKYLLPRAINERLSLHWKTADIDWSRTKAFVIENANEGFIRVNLRGREPQGIVEGLDEHARICASLLEAARTMTNPLNGAVAASGVHKAEDLYSGPCRADMPDVIINWDPRAEITTKLETERYGVVTAEVPAYGVSPYYSGNHRPNAFIAGIGPEVRKAARGDASILDVVPTILAHFGVPLPAHLDGAIADFLAGSEEAASIGSHPHPLPLATLKP